MSLAGYGDIFLQNVMASGVIPQITAIMGPSAGGAVYSPALTDWIFMVEKTSHMFITGPEVIKAVTREMVTKEDLGGAMAHNAKSGVAHFAAPDDARLSCQDPGAAWAFCPRTTWKTPPVDALHDDPAPPGREPCGTWFPPIPTSPTISANIICSNLDDHYFFEVQEHWAKNIVIGLRPAGRHAGRASSPTSPR